MTLLRYAEPVLLVGAGPATLADFEHVRGFAGAVVAVDGGYDALRAWGVAPDAVLGDMDSIAGPVAEGVVRLPIDEQESTDLEKALRAVDAPLYLGIGFLGGRLDHTLAATHALVGAVGRSAILIGSEDLVFATPTEWRARLPIGTRVSFYPAHKVTASGSLGLRWPIDGLVMEAGGQIGVSNEVSADIVEARFEARGAVTIIPREHLPEIIESLT